MSETSENPLRAGCWAEVSAQPSERALRLRDRSFAGEFTRESS